MTKIQVQKWWRLHYFKEDGVSGPANFIFHRTWTIAFYVILFLRLVWKIYKWILWWYRAHSLVSLKHPLSFLLHFTHKWVCVSKPSWRLSLLLVLAPSGLIKALASKQDLINPNCFHFHFSFVVWMVFLENLTKLFFANLPISLWNWEKPYKTQENPTLKLNRL